MPPPYRPHQQAYIRRLIRGPLRVRCRLFRWGGVLVGSVDGVVGPDVSKRRGLKSRWPGVSSRNRAMTRCFRCVSGVLSVSRCMVPGLISSVLDTWRVHCAVPAPESGPPRSGPGWGGALEGAWALSWTRACAANASSRLIMRAGASSSGMKSALREAVTVDGWTPRRFRPPLPRRPGLDQPCIPPSTLEDRPRTTDTTCRNTREPTNKPLKLKP